MVNHDLIRLRQALELIASTDPVDAALDPQRALRVAREALSSAPHPAPADDSNADEQWHEGWFVEGRLLCRITDERKPANRDEICVTLANGSRSEEACGARARQLLDCIRGVAQQIGGGNG